MLRLAALSTIAMALLAVGAIAEPPLEPNTCAVCHEDPLETAVPDVHRAAGLKCTDCHGGNASAEDPELAMDPRKGFIGRPNGRGAVSLCGGCHSDIERMRAVNPRLPTDQLAQYRTSVHGKLLAKGNERVATCVSCHGAHGIRSARDPASTASKERIVETCSGCHNSKYMAGAALPTDQLAKYRLSVHGKRRLAERDPSAPACNDCHGNHGAAPPGVYAVSHVCGKCHVTQAETFEASSHAKHFRESGVPPCTTCHNHHDILPTSDELLGTGPSGSCSACHEPGDQCDRATQAMRAGLLQLDAAISRARASLGRADRLGMDVERATYDLTPAAEALVRARVAVHAFSEEEFSRVIGDGIQVADEVERVALVKLDEYRYRRKGLAVAAGFLLLLAGLLARKARQLERRRLGLET